MPTFDAKCPLCNGEFQAEEEWIGQNGECPSCGKEIKIERIIVNTIQNTDEKLCPFCGETISRIAIKCKHCKSEIKESTPIKVATELHRKIPAQNNIYKNIIVASGLIIGLIIIVFIVVYSFFIKSNPDRVVEKQTNTKAQLSSQRDKIISDLKTYLENYSDEQIDYLVYDKVISSDDKTALQLRLLNENKLGNYIKLKEQLVKVESTLKQNLPSSSSAATPKNSMKTIVSISTEVQTKNILDAVKMIDLDGNDYISDLKILEDAIKNNPKANNLDSAREVLELTKELYKHSKSAVIVNINLREDKNGIIKLTQPFGVLLKDDELVTRYMNDIKSADKVKQFEFYLSFSKDLAKERFTTAGFIDSIVQEKMNFNKISEIPPGKYYIYVSSTFASMTMNKEVGLFVWLIPITKKDQERCTIELNNDNAIIYSMKSEFSPNHELSDSKKASSVVSSTKKTGWAVDKLKGQVKEQVEINYNVKEKAGKNIKEISGKHVKKYDENGNKVEDVAYDGKGNLFSKSISKYDDKGNEIERAFYNANGVLTSKSISKYDDRGNKIELASYHASGVLTSRSVFKYNDRGDEIDNAEYNANGGLTSRCISKYDDKRDKIEEVTYNEKGELFFKSISKYDAMGNRTECIGYNPNGTLSFKFISKYDDKGNKIENAEYNEKGTLTGINTLSYIYY